jgi:hypothetical protein
MHLAKEHKAGVEATLMVAIDEAHALDWLTREAGDSTL